MQHGIPVLSTQALYPIPCLLGFLPIDCDQCEIIEEIYQENIRAGDRDALHPGVKNGKEADVGAEMLGIGSNRLERLGGRPKENAVEGALVLQADVGNLFGHSKDNMKRFGLEKLRLSVL